MTQVSNAGAADKLSGTARPILDAKGSTVYTINASASVYEAVAKMDECHVGALFVVEDGAPLGVISERDYTRKIILHGRSSKDTPVAEIMTSPVISVEPSTPLGECMQIVTERRVRHLAVVESARIVGVVSIGDLVRAIIAQQAETIDHLSTIISGPYPA
jgi:signal-transduction protein with cAMP-binding, CBS, and nucleotidyltransferase domain